jgi:outer membrane protein insertion porin family
VTGRAEFYGALGGDYTFQKFTLGYDHYFTLAEDLLDRKTVLALRGNVGYITGDSVFFERFYGGGIGSVRGFEFRGISPRQGLDDDPIGGDFSITGTAEIGFPLYGESLRGVVFTDVGKVEEDWDVGKLRSSAGAGIRLVLPFLGQIPVAVDVAFPITKDDEDETQFFSFSFGFFQ